MKNKKKIVYFFKARQWKTSFSNDANLIYFILIILESSSVIVKKQLLITCLSKLHPATVPHFSIFISQIEESTKTSSPSQDKDHKHGLNQPLVWSKSASDMVQISQWLVRISPL